MRKLVVLDFDGTIYNGDSMLDFAAFIDRKKYKRSLWKIFFPYLLCLIKLRKRDRLKKQFIRIHFKGKTRHELTELGEKFYKTHHMRCFESALNFIRTEHSNGSDLLILSGSCVEWLGYFSDKFEAKLLCTQLKYDENGICLGAIDGKNVVGQQKVKELQAFLDRSAPYDSIIAFGDTTSDALLVEVAHEFHRDYFR